jgi:hypothetical protein
MNVILICYSRPKIFCIYDIFEDLLALFDTMLPCFMTTIYEYIYLVLFALNKNKFSLSGSGGCGYSSSCSCSSVVMIPTYYHVYK